MKAVLTNFDLHEHYTPSYEHVKSHFIIYQDPRPASGIKGQTGRNEGERTLLFGMQEFGQARRSMVIYNVLV